MIFEFKIFKMMFKTDDYQKFLLKLSSFISVDSRILDNLIKFKLIHTIFKNPEQIHISKNFFSFSNRISLKEYYKDNPAYILALCSLRNNDLAIFKALRFNQNEQSRSTTPIMIYKQRFLKSDLPVMIYIYKQREDSFFIDFRMIINLQTFTDHNIKLLSENELLDLKKTILNLKMFHATQSFDSKHNKYIFFNEELVNPRYLNDELNSYFKESNDKIKFLISYFKNDKKSEIDKFFEPALLRKELDIF